MRKFAVLTLGFMVVSSLGIAQKAFDQEKADQESQIVTFVGGIGGGFQISFPESGPAGQAVGVSAGFEDIYGDKTGLTYGAEAGLGSREYGIFAVIRFRQWQKNGSPIILGGFTFNGETKWKQDFVSLGGRYFYKWRSASDKSFHPYVGGGIIHSTATESVDGELSSSGSTQALVMSQSVSGTGAYFEFGANLRLDKDGAIGFILEYSKLKLGVTESGQRIEVDGGGGAFIGVTLTAFFGDWPK